MSHDYSSYLKRDGNNMTIEIANALTVRDEYGRKVR
jgi:hypothetical protein